MRSSERLDWIRGAFHSLWTHPDLKLWSICTCGHVSMRSTHWLEWICSLIFESLGFDQIDGSACFYDSNVVRSRICDLSSPVHLDQWDFRNDKSRFLVNDQKWGIWLDWRLRSFHNFWTHPHLELLSVCAYGFVGARSTKWLEWICKMITRCQGSGQINWLVYFFDFSGPSDVGIAIHFLL